MSDEPKPEFQLHPPWFLLPDANQVDVAEVFWELEKKIEATQERDPHVWGWLDKACHCGEPAVMWDQVNGYRCGDHR